MVVMLKQCCCGCSLKTGTIIIGTLNLIGGALVIATATVLLVLMSLVIQQEEKEVPEETKTAAIVIGIVLIILGALTLIVSILLLVGATKGRPGLLTPWMVTGIIGLVASIIFNVIKGGAYISQGESDKGVFTIFGTIISGLVQVYYILVVYSLYRELKGTAQV